MKLFTREQLIRACKVADRTKRNRRIAWEKLPEDIQYFPIAFNFIHNDVEMRVQVVIDTRQSSPSAWLDIPIHTYDKLPEISQDELKELAATV